MSLDSGPREEPITTKALRMSRSELWLSLVFLVLITAAVYSPIVNQQFSNWDDPKHIEAVWKPGWERAWRIITDFDLRFTTAGYYTPIHFLSLMLDQALVGPGDHAQAWIAKLMNVCYHGANTLLVFALLTAAGVRRRPAFLGALIFCVHPVQVGTVAWIAERKNLLATLFYLSAMMVYLDYLKSRGLWRPLLVVVLFLAGLLSKPAVVTFPVALALWLLLLPERRPEGSGPYILLGGLFVLSLAWGAYTISTEVSYPGVLPPPLYRPFIAATAFWFYLGKFLFPHDLVLVYPRWDVTGDSRPYMLFLGAFVASAGMLAYYWKKIDTLILWGGLFFAVNILPVSGFVPFGHMGHSFVADHFLYLPMAGLSLMVARGLDMTMRRLGEGSRSATLVAIGAYAIVCVLAVLSVRQGWLWRNPAALWEATLRVNKTSPAVYNNYGRVCMMVGDNQKALAMFKRSVELAPSLEAPYHNMGQIYNQMGNRAAARAMFETARAINPKSTFPVVMLGSMLRDEGKYDESIKYFRESLPGHQGAAVIRTELALSYYAAGREQEAIKELDRVIREAPLLPLSYVHKAMILLTKGDADHAAELLEKSLTLGASPEAYNMLGAAYARKRDYSRSLKAYSKALELKPDLRGLGDNLAGVLLDMKDVAAAREVCGEVARAGRPCSDQTLRRLEATQPGGTSR